MTASYLRRGMTEEATFSLFVRNLPPSRGFLVAAGLEDCLDYLETLAFEAEDLAWLRAHGFGAADVERFASLRFTGDVHAAPEGRVVLADEPLLEITAPLPEAQLVETYLLNQVTFQTAVATKALRCRLAARDVPLVDFALRRTQGTDAGRGVARSSAIAGFAATSNVEAARRYGLAAAGTMAHSYVQAFPSEVEALRAFVEDFPDRATLLVDTYDTLEGVRRAAALLQELRRARHGLGQLAIRIDSGDLVSLARKSRAILDEAGLRDVGIFVSGGLDEYDLEAMRIAGAPIDGAGIGTRMGVSADAPYLDTVYKLVSVGARPVVKLSSGKATLPGPKQVWRRRPIKEDLLDVRAGAPPPGARSPDPEPLLLPVMRAGARIAPAGSLEAARRLLEQDLSGLPPSALDLRRPVPPRVVVSERLRALGDAVAADAGRPRADG